MKKLLLATLVVATIGLSGAKGQDLSFSQYYSAPLYLNPAFAGSTPSYRFMANYRNQWPGVGNGFRSYALSFDMMLPAWKSGIGVLLLGDQAGVAALKSSIVNVQYSYKINTASRWVIAPGLNFGVGNRSLDFNKLLFYDQLTLDGNVTPSNTVLAPDSKMYFDFGAGLVVYNPKVWFGASFSHLNEPNRSLIGGVSTLPMKWSVHGGVRVEIMKRSLRRNGSATALLPSFNYRSQGKFDQLDIGTHLLLDPVVLGIWYRGIPIRQDVSDNMSQDAVIAMLGLRLATIDVMYSYDITVSGLGFSTGGAHEISLKYEINRLMRTKKKQRFIPCPAFYNNHDLNLQKLSQ